MEILESLSRTQGFTPDPWRDLVEVTASYKRYEDSAIEGSQIKEWNSIQVKAIGRPRRRGSRAPRRSLFTWQYSFRPSTDGRQQATGEWHFVPPMGQARIDARSMNLETLDVPDSRSIDEGIDEAALEAQKRPGAGVAILAGPLTISFKDNIGMVYQFSGSHDYLMSIPISTQGFLDQQPGPKRSAEDLMQE